MQNLKAEILVGKQQAWVWRRGLSILYIGTHHFILFPSLRNLFVEMHAYISSWPRQPQAQATKIPHEHSIPSEEMHPDQNGIWVCSILALEEKRYNK